MNGTVVPAPDDERRSKRHVMDAQVMLRRAGRVQYRVRIHDASCHGCMLEFVERPALAERVWIRFDGLEAIEGSVCWVEGFQAGVEFINPVHSAVFDSLLSRLR